MKKNVFTLAICLAFFFASQAQTKTNRWDLTADGGIVWNVKSGEAHSDHIEMSGTQVSAIVYYGVDKNGELSGTKKLVFPMLRTIPNNTHASLIVDFNEPTQLQILANGTGLLEYPKSFSLKGKLTVISTTNSLLETTRTIFPSVDKPALIEIITLKNTGKTPCLVEINNNSKPVETDPAKGVYGQYIVKMDVQKTGKYILAPGDEFSFSAVYSGRKLCEEAYLYSPEFELNKRDNFVNGMFSNLILETPNDTINREFAFAKIRGTESIYDTKGGLMHGPGGGAYYAAIWANDQAEYISPFYPFLGNLNGNESAINCYRHFARFMNPEYKPIPSSIISEGVGTWHGAKDRGDQAMLAYGASRFALAYGDKKTALELWPLIEWCLEYLERKKSVDGVIFSDSDELENRFENGDYNLATNSLTYGGLIAASNLAVALNKPDAAEIYKTRAATLKIAIEKYFGAKVQGFDTYQYYEGNTKLRAWICYPLNMGIFDRKDETVKALFSEFLWTSNGLLSESGTETFWDRSTLHAFKGFLAAGATDKTMKYLAYYSSKRLLGEHVPYPVEAWPEGNQRHLSAESGLYCRVMTEGLFGIEPVGFREFKLKPLLPEGWNFMKLRNIRAFQSNFDINVFRDGKSTKIQVFENGQLLKEIKWDRKNELVIHLN